jgi:hypothetical protein
MSAYCKLYVYNLLSMTMPPLCFRLHDQPNSKVTLAETSYPWLCCYKVADCASRAAGARLSPQRVFSASECTAVSRRPRHGVIRSSTICHVRLHSIPFSLLLPVARADQHIRVSLSRLTSITLPMACIVMSRCRGHPYKYRPVPGTVLSLKSKPPSPQVLLHATHPLHLNADCLRYVEPRHHPPCCVV